jgi:hypothetical protein
MCEQPSALNISISKKNTGLFSPPSLQCYYTTHPQKQKGNTQTDLCTNWNVRYPPSSAVSTKNKVQLPVQYDWLKAFHMPIAVVQPRQIDHLACYIPSMLQTSWKIMIVWKNVNPPPAGDVSLFWHIPHLEQNTKIPFTFITPRLLDWCLTVSVLPQNHTLWSQVSIFTSNYLLDKIIVWKPCPTEGDEWVITGSILWK